MRKGKDKKNLTQSRGKISRNRSVIQKKGGTGMNITYIGRQITVYEDLKEFAAKKLAKFDRYFPSGADATVTLRKIRDKACMEITISVGGTLFRAEETTADFRTSLARCVDTIEGQIRRIKQDLNGA